MLPFTNLPKVSDDAPAPTPVDPSRGTPRTSTDRFEGIAAKLGLEPARLCAMLGYPKDNWRNWKLHQNLPCPVEYAAELFWDLDERTKADAQPVAKLAILSIFTPEQESTILTIAKAMGLEVQFR